MEYTYEDCLDRNNVEAPCGGDVEKRPPLSSRSLDGYVRCDVHWERACNRQDEITARYPDSPFPPGWFDPTYAGESWDED